MGEDARDLDCGTNDEVDASSSGVVGEASTTAGEEGAELSGGLGSVVGETEIERCDLDGVGVGET